MAAAGGSIGVAEEDVKEVFTSTDKLGLVNEAGSCTVLPITLDISLLTAVVSAAFVAIVCADAGSLVLIVASTCSPTNLRSCVKRLALLDSLTSTISSLTLFMLAMAVVACCSEIVVPCGNSYEADTAYTTSTTSTADVSTPVVSAILWMYAS